MGGAERATIQGMFFVVQANLCKIKVIRHALTTFMTAVSTVVFYAKLK